MEVLLATAILLGSVLVLMELGGIGRRCIESVDRRTTAQTLCFSKLNEILSGLAPLEEVQQRPLENDPEWVYTVEILPVSGIDLASLRVTVSELQVDSLGELPQHKPKSFTLVRWIPDPSVDRPSESADESAMSFFD
jgi:hypothetical protein